MGLGPDQHAQVDELIEFLKATGTRVSEALGVHVEDLDLTGGNEHVPTRSGGRVSALHQWDSLIGVAVGALLAALTAWLNDRRQSKHSDRKQWHQQRLAAYTAAWTRLSDVALAMQEIVSKYGKPRLLAPLAPLRVLQQAVPIQSALREAGEALTVIRFIGGKEVVDAADLCADVIVDLGAAIGAGDTTPDQLEELVQLMNKRRHHLVDVARIELDVDPRPSRRRRGPGQLGSSAERIALLDSPSERHEQPAPGGAVS